MGTFHHDKGELHGITVVVDTHGDRVWVGRCDQVTPQGVILLDADAHDATDDAPKEAFVRRAAQVGIWKKHDRVVVPDGEVASITPLGELRG